jgi:hypothetical protein
LRMVDSYVSIFLFFPENIGNRQDTLLRRQIHQVSVLPFR